MGKMATISFFLRLLSFRTTYLLYIGPYANSINQIIEQSASNKNASSIKKVVLANNRKCNICW